jgi:hypothetical protein
MASRWNYIAWLEAEADRIAGQDAAGAEQLRQEANSRRNAIAQDSHHVD